MSFITDLWTRLKTAVEGEATTVETTLTAMEQKYMPAFGAWCKKMETIAETQGITLLEQGLQDIGTVVMTGGNPTTAIAALVPQVEAQVAADLKTDENIVRADAKNTAYTAIGLAIAALPSASASADTSQAPAPAA